MYDKLSFADVRQVDNKPSHRVEFDNGSILFQLRRKFEQNYAKLCIQKCNGLEMNLKMKYNGRNESKMVDKHGTNENNIDLDFDEISLQSEMRVGCTLSND